MNYTTNKEILSVIVNNNLKGIKLEKSKNIDEAIKLYEENIYNPFNDTPHPFKRLMIIYRKRKDIPNEIRVINLALNSLPKNQLNHYRFDLRLNKIKSK